MNVEDHMILRVPEDWLQEFEGKHRLEINPIDFPDEDSNRVFSVKVKNKVSLGFLLDLPCIIESHKTLDCINFFKACDIAQMLLVVPEYEKSNPRGKYSTLSKTLVKGTKYKAKSGITPGTHNITSRFFRQEMVEDPEEVKKVESLIKKVMDTGTAKIVEEEIIELKEDELVPENQEYIYNPQEEI